MLSLRTRACQTDSAASDPCTSREPARLRGFVYLRWTADGLVECPPRTLVSSGARAFAQGNGIETVDATSMVAPRAREDWQRWTKRYDEVPSTDEPGADTASLPQYVMQDTVGAVAWDAEGNMAAGVSRSADRCSSAFVDTADVCDSGGLLLKYSGRVGEVKLPSGRDDGVAD